MEATRWSVTASNLKLLSTMPLPIACVCLPILLWLDAIVGATELSVHEQKEETLADDARGYLARNAAGLQGTCGSGERFRRRAGPRTRAGDRFCRPGGFEVQELSVLPGRTTALRVLYNLGRSEPGWKIAHAESGSGAAGAVFSEHLPASGTLASRALNSFFPAH